MIPVFNTERCAFTFHITYRFHLTEIKHENLQQTVYEAQMKAAEISKTDLIILEVIAY